MSYVFNGTSQGLALATAPATATPLTISAWANADTDHRGGVFSIADSATVDEYFALLMDGVEVGDPVAFWRRAGGGAPDVANTSTGFTPGTWHHVCGVSRSATDVSVYIDGGSEGTSTTSKVPASIDQCTVGAVRGSTASGYFDGKVAEVAVWSVDLTVAEVSALAAGHPAWMIRANALTFYAPLLGTAQEHIGQTTMTDINVPTQAEHPPQLPFVFCRPWWQPDAAAPVGDLGADVQDLLDRWAGWR